MPAAAAGPVVGRGRHSSSVRRRLVNGVGFRKQRGWEDTDGTDV